jgi:hypothetical protein
MTAARPAARPRLSRDDVVARVKAAYPNEPLPAVFVVGIRGYYLDSLGAVGRNDRGVYDDALFVVTPETFAAFNGNTDPSRVRAGQGTGAGKGMARLKAGFWRAHHLGMHKAASPTGHPALVQRAGEVTVIRDGKAGDYEETGWFGINIHKGGVTTTSSEGCQTVPPDQWPAFYAAVRAALTSYRQTVLPYILLEEG